MAAAPEPRLTCDECGEEKPDVEVMIDPFCEALYPGDPGNPVMSLCHPCAAKRFEDS